MGLGEAIGLQNTTKQQGDPLSWLKLAGAEKRAERAQAKKEAHELVKRADFKTDYSKILPPWSDAIVDINKAILNKAAQATQEGSVSAENQFYQDVQEAQKMIGELMISNDNAMAYNKQHKGEYNVDPTLQQLMQTPGATFKDLTKYTTENNLNPFVVTDETGTFSFMETKKVDPLDKVKIDASEKRILEKQKRPSSIPNNYIVPQETYRTEDQYISGASKLAQDPEIIATTVFNDPELRKMFSSTDPNAQKQLGEIIQQRMYEKLKAGYPEVTMREEVMKSFSSAPSGSTKKYNAPVVTEPTFATMKRTVIDESGKRVDGGTGQMEIPISKNVTTKPVGLQLNDKMINAETNKFIVGESKQFTFRPLTLQEIPMKAGGYKTYVLGEVVQNVGEDEYKPSELEINYKKLKKSKEGDSSTDSEKTEKIIRVMVPYEGGVKSAIDASNDVSDYEKAKDDFINKRGKWATKAPTQKKATKPRPY